MIRIHSIELTDVAGTAHRRVDFSDITVLRGDNEVGKTTLMNALDLLLSSFDSSVAGPVKAIIPKQRDAAPQIRADITIGDHRLTYFKRFAVRPFPGMTEAVFAEPEDMAGRTLTGRDAHDKVRALLAEHTDETLWKALWVQQTGSIALPELQGKDSLLQAVDAAAGLASGDESGDRRNTTILEAAEAQYGLYYTQKRGELTKTNKAKETAATQAEQQLAAAEQAARDVEEWVNEHASAGRKLTTARQDLEELKPRQEELTSQSAALETAAQAIAALEREAMTADGQAASIRQLLDVRHRLVADARAAADAESDAEEAAQGAAHAAEAAKTTADTADGEVPVLQAAAAASSARVAEARTALDALRDTEELAGLRNVLEHIDTHTPQLQQLNDDLAALPAVEAADLTAIESAAAAEATARALLEADSPRLTVEALADIAVEGLADDTHLAAGQSREWPLTADATVTAANVVRITVTPGVNETDRRQAAASAAAKLRAQLEAVGVPDAFTARATAARRSDIGARADALRAGIDAVLAGRSEADIRAHADRLQTRTRRLDGDGPLPGTRAEAEQALSAAELDAERDAGRHAAAVAAAQTLRDAARGLDADARIAAGSLTNAKTAALACATALKDARDKESDADLAQRARDAAEAATAANDRWKVALAAHDQAAADRVAADLKAVQAAVATASGAIRQMEDIQLQMNTRLQQAGDVHEALARATDVRDRAVGDYQAMLGRAEAAKLLLETLTAARAQARAVYADPYKERLEALAGIAFGRDVKLDLDGNLAVTARTMDGATVEFTSLSGGAKEQLAVCARLAFASLISKSSGLVPVIIDDALGYTDDERMENIDRVFNAARTGCQVIILTCTRKRYAGVAGASTVELTR